MDELPNREAVGGGISLGLRRQGMGRTQPLDALRRLRREVAQGTRGGDVGHTGDLTERELLEVEVGRTDFAAVHDEEVRREGVGAVLMEPVSPEAGAPVIFLRTYWAQYPADLGVTEPISWLPYGQISESRSDV